MRTAERYIWVVTLIGLFSMVGLETVAAREKANLGEKIKKERLTLEELKGKIKKQKSKAVKAEKKRKSILQSIQKLDRNLLSSRRKRNSAQKKLKERDQELEVILKQLALVQDRMADRQTSIEARVRTQYKKGRFGYLKALLSTDSPVDMHRRFHYLSAISHQELALIDAHRHDLDRLREAEKQRVKAREAVVSLKKSSEARLAEFQRLKKKKRVILAKITREKTSYEQATAELERSARRLDSLLSDLEKRRKAAAFTTPKALKNLKAVKGSLPWPVRGKVVSFFGRQKHPTFKTYVQRKGIEIRTKEGSKILAVMPGTVSYADWLKGYGLVLILEHGNGFFSLYAHASKLLTSVGTKVKAGEVIGKAGDTGLTGDSTLYFELRKGAKPVDPMKWLAKR